MFSDWQISVPPEALTCHPADDEVWRPVKAMLDERDLGLSLEPKVIRSGDDEVEFRHAWKNEAWHVYQRLSLDPADADGIRNKAHRWLGAWTSLGANADEAFEPYFIVGAPTDPRLGSAYDSAIRILRKAPKPPHISEKGDVSSLVNQIEDELRDHRAAE